MAPTNIDAALSRIEQHIASNDHGGTGSSRGGYSNAGKRSRFRNASRKPASDAARNIYLKNTRKAKHASEKMNVSVKETNMQTATETTQIPASTLNTGAFNNIPKVMSSSSVDKHNSKHHNVVHPVFRKPSPITEISLGQHNYPQLDFLMGALGFLTGSEPHWITWVNPPHWAQGLLRELTNDAEQMRMLHGDKAHSTFHLFYKSIQAGNSSWIIGPAEELTVKEREILKQAADHFDCRLLLLNTLDANEAVNGNMDQGLLPQTIDLFGDSISDNASGMEAVDDTEAVDLQHQVSDKQQQLFAI